MNIRQIEQQLAALREQHEELSARRALIEEQLWKISEQYRMGALSLMEYDHQITEVRKDRSKEEQYAEIDQQFEGLQRAEQQLEEEHATLRQHLPLQRTVTGMQIAFALLVAITLIGSVLVLDHPQGMVIYQRPHVSAPTASPAPSWPSTTTPQNPPAP